MKTNDQFRQCWPDTETRATVPPKRPLWLAVATVAQLLATAGTVYLIVVVLFSL
jgi:hypothetical protein